VNDRNDSARNDENVAAWMIGGGDRATARSWAGREQALRPESQTPASHHGLREPLLRRISTLLRAPRAEIRSTTPGGASES
jgi:hypothetical protein